MAKGHLSACRPTFALITCQDHNYLPKAILLDQTTINLKSLSSSPLWPHLIDTTLDQKPTETSCSTHFKSPSKSLPWLCSLISDSIRIQQILFTWLMFIIYNLIPCCHCCSFSNQYTLLWINPLPWPWLTNQPYEVQVSISTMKKCTCQIPPTANPLTLAKKPKKSINSQPYQQHPYT